MEKERYYHIKEMQEDGVVHVKQVKESELNKRDEILLLNELVKAFNSSPKVVRKKFLEMLVEVYEEKQDEQLKA